MEDKLIKGFFALLIAAGIGVAAFLTLYVIAGFVALWMELGPVYAFGFYGAGLLFFCGCYWIVDKNWWRLD